MDKDRIVLPTCEVSMDPETAIEMGRSWGIKHFEIKTLWENRRRLGREVETSGSTGMDAARGSPADGEHGLRAGLG